MLDKLGNVFAEAVSMFRATRSRCFGSQSCFLVTRQLFLKSMFCLIHGLRTSEKGVVIYRQFTKY